MWTCPYCQQPVPLTWKRYFTEPGLKHTCPHCGKVSRLDGTTSAGLWAARGAGILAGYIPCAILGFRYGFFPAMLAGIVGGFITGTPVDKYLDGKYRRLVPIAGQD